VRLERVRGDSRIVAPDFPQQRLPRYRPLACAVASPRAPSTGAPPTDRSVQVIVEIEAKAATVERLFMICERQEWTFGETLEYALDALELALAKMATG
jgi:hypothetical protein